MCIAPIPVPNPNSRNIPGIPFRRKNPDYNPNVVGSSPYIYGYRERSSNVEHFLSLKDSAFNSMFVPCGCCPQCLRKKQLSYVQRAIEQSKNHHILFCTNTYSNIALRKLQIPSITSGEIGTFFYTDYQDVRFLFNMAWRNKIFPEGWKYLCSSEYGKKRHRPHIHYLIFIPYQDSDTLTTPFYYQDIWLKHMFRYWSRNYGSRKFPKYVPNSLFLTKWIYGKLYSTYDCRPVSPDLSDQLNVAFYVSKYVLKPDDFPSNVRHWLYYNCTPEEAKRYWSLLRPFICSSRFFGVNEDTRSSIRYHVDTSISVSDSSYFQYYMPDGKAVPLSRYYRSGKPSYTRPDGKVIPGHNYVTLEDVECLSLRDAVPGSRSFYQEPKTMEDADRIQESFKRSMSLLLQNSIDIPELLDEHF